MLYPIIFILIRWHAESEEIPEFRFALSGKTFSQKSFFLFDSTFILKLSTLTK
jgi:hypothetical protein